MLLSTLGLLGGLVLLIILTVRGVNLLIAAPICALLVALMSGMPLYTDNGSYYFQTYMSGFAGFVSSWYLMFLTGSLFGKMMEGTGSANSIAKYIIKHIGMKHAALAIVLACAILTYGGVSVFIVAFAVYPMALSLFREADLPRRFIPGALAFGSVTFTMTSAGSPEIQNWIPTKYLGTTPYAGWQVSLIVALVMACFGYWWLNRMLAKAKAQGEKFEERPLDPAFHENDSLPNPILSLVPLVIVVVTSALLHKSMHTNALVIALVLGSLSSYLLNLKRVKDLGELINTGVSGSLLAIGNTAAVVGFGAIAKETPAFESAVQLVTQIPGNELIGAAVAVSLIAGLTGSASGGQSIALPLLAPHYTDLGVDPDQLHRVVAISSGAIDSLPHNGYVVTTVRAICRESHADAYGAVGALTVIVPLIGLTIAIILFTLGL
tara:strand:- start:57756 stop:59063 length:1308 start_codon:yes stop_codon:yes gene_type:complete